MRLGGFLQGCVSAGCFYVKACYKYRIPKGSFLTYELRTATPPGRCFNQRPWRSGKVGEKPTHGGQHGRVSRSFLPGTQPYPKPSNFGFDQLPGEGVFIMVYGYLDPPRNKIPNLFQPCASFRYLELPCARTCAFHGV